MSDRDTSISEAAFREALERAAKVSKPWRCAECGGGYPCVCRIEASLAKEEEAQVSAMPERVWLIPDPYAMSGDWWADGKTVREDGEVPYVPESRLLAAEARVREMEEQASRPVPLDYGRHPITDARRDFIHHALTYPGFVGNRDLFVEAARDLAAEAATLRAERDALVPLARVGLFLRDKLLAGVTNTDLREHLVWCLEEWVVAIDGEDTPCTTQARAILAREET